MSRWDDFRLRLTETEDVIEGETREEKFLMEFMLGIASCEIYSWDDACLHFVEHASLYYLSAGACSGLVHHETYIRAKPAASGVRLNRDICFAPRPIPQQFVTFQYRLDIVCDAVHHTQ